MSEILWMSQELISSSPSPWAEIHDDRDRDFITFGQPCNLGFFTRQGLKEFRQIFVQLSVRTISSQTPKAKLCGCRMNIKITPRKPA